MPTPESEAFLAKKPTVPPTFDGVDYEDTRRLKQAQDAIIREQWVQVMMGRLVREELSKCYYREGINHLEKCGRLRGQFFFFSYSNMRALRHRLRPGLHLRADWADTEQSGILSCSRPRRSGATSSSRRTTCPRGLSNRVFEMALRTRHHALRAGHIFW